MSQYPSNLFYTKEHEWLLIEGNKAKVGITSYAAEQLGDVVHADLPKVGQEFEKGASIGTVESVKSVSDIYIPVTAKVISVNEDLVMTSGLINEDPYKSGWIVEIEISNLDELKELLDAKAYEAFLSEEA